MSDLSLLVIGAHPDDCSIKAGGIAATYAEAGHDVTFLAATDGRAGHHVEDPDEVAKRRHREAQAVADTLDISYEILDNADGTLTASLDTRKQFVRRIRSIGPDLVLSHRPYDYHPDHRACGQLLADAAYLLIVPNVCPDTHPLETVPVMGYLQDGFEKPTPFDPDLVLDVSDHEEIKLDALHCHTSQLYEWLPYTWGLTEQVPETDADRREWLAEIGVPRLNEMMALNVAATYPDNLERRYGDEAESITHAEAIELSEFGRSPSEADLERLFFW